MESNAKDERLILGGSIRRDDEMVVPSRWGDLAILGGDDPIGRSVLEYGEWAQIEIEFLAQFLERADVVVDVGSHVGIHACAFASLATEATVYAFEPHPVLFGLLRRNAARFGGRIRPIRSALGAIEGRGFMPTFPESGPVNAGASAVLPEGGPGLIPVEIATIDGLGLGRVDFLKLDAEGMEDQIIEGARATLRTYGPVLSCEVNTLRAGIAILDAIRGLSSYVPWFVALPAFNPAHHRESSRDLFGPAHEMGLLLIPDGHPDPVRVGASILEVVRDPDDLALAMSRVPGPGKSDLPNRKESAFVRRLRELDRRLGRDREERSRRRRELAEECVASQGDTIRLQDSIRDRERRIDDLASRNRDLADRFAAADAEVAMLRERTELLTSMLRTQETRTGTLRKGLGLAEIGAGALRGQLARREREIAGLETGIAGLTAHRSTILEAIAARPAWILRPGLFGRLLRRCSRTDLARSARLIEGSGLFDRHWYEARRGGHLHGLDSVVHYLLIGGFLGMDPSNRFDSDRYLKSNRDVLESGMNPLLHYVKWGRSESRQWNTDLAAPPDPAGSAGVVPFRPVAPPLDRFIDLRRRRPTDGAGTSIGIDVVVPVYGAFDATLACLESLLSARNETECSIIVVDDRSPDPELSEALRLIAGLGLITVLENPANLGFVASANRGMRLHADRDIVLLNSDTLVFDGWLDRMIAHAKVGTRVATVTPFTTNGTICSYPRMCVDNVVGFGIDHSEFDRRLANVNRGKSLDIPTGVGFCMFVARAAIDEVGLLDEVAFGRGYGEENDFCMRATAAGWRHLHALDVFVFHAGESSFGTSGAAGRSAGMEVLRQRYPGYEALIRNHVDRDPARKARMRADAARLRGSGRDGATLCLTHVQGGGIARHLKDLAAEHSSRGRDLFLFSPARPGSLAGTVRRPSQNEPYPNLTDIELQSSGNDFVEVLEALGVDRVEVHSTWGWSWRLIEVLPEVLSRAGLPLAIKLHDYVAVCPRVTLIDDSGAYCGERGIEQCRSCLARRPSATVEVHPDLANMDPVDIERWRIAYGRFLESATEVQAPSRDASSRFGKYFPVVQVRVQPHREDLSHVSPLARSRGEGKPARVAVIGAIGPHKGSAVLLACAREARRSRSPLEFVVVGYTDIDAELRHAGVRITGPYEEIRVGEILSALEVDAAFLPSLCPESHCYTLSIAMAAGLPICVFDLGAPRERLDVYPRASRIPLTTRHLPGEINRAILDLLVAG